MALFLIRCNTKNNAIIQTMATPDFPESDYNPTPNKPLRYPGMVGISLLLAALGSSLLSQAISHQPWRVFFLILCLCLLIIAIIFGALGVKKSIRFFHVLSIVVTALSGLSLVGFLIVPAFGLALGADIFWPSSASMRESEYSNVINAFSENRYPLMLLDGRTGNTYQDGQKAFLPSLKELKLTEVEEQALHEDFAFANAFDDNQPTYRVSVDATKGYLKSQYSSGGAWSKTTSHTYRVRDFGKLKQDVYSFAREEEDREYSAEWEKFQSYAEFAEVFRGNNAIFSSNPDCRSFDAARIREAGTELKKLTFAPKEETKRYIDLLDDPIHYDENYLVFGRSIVPTDGTYVEYRLLFQQKRCFLIVRATQTYLTPREGFSERETHQFAYCQEYVLSDEDYQTALNILRSALDC